MAQELFLGRKEVTAYKRAGYGGDPRKNAAKIANLPDVQARVAELNGKVERTAVLDKQEALEMLSAGARSAFRLIREATSISGQGLLTLKADVLKNHPELLHAVKEVVNHADGLHQTVRIHAFQDMIATIAKLEGWEAPKNLTIRRRPLEELSDKELDELDPSDV
jgi:hypothetical protein